MNIFLVVLAVLAVMFVASALFFKAKNLDYHKRELKAVFKAGFAEKDAQCPTGTTLHYGESAANGKPPLLLIHGQTGNWEDYAKVLPALSQQFHVFAVDCPGHGKSSHNSERYAAKYIAEDLHWFIENVIGAPAYVSGHSSGGLLTALLAATYPTAVTAVLLEDPPFYSTERGERWEKSFAYVDTYEPMHRFINQSAEKDWVIFYIKNCGWMGFVPEKPRKKLVATAIKQRARHPDRPLQIYFLPPALNHMFLSLDAYDVRFGEMFYDGSWFEDFDQSETLSKIVCPAVLIHNTWSYNENGILMAAMSGEDADRANSLMKNSEIYNIESGHDSHLEHPDEFLKAMDVLVSKTDK